MMIQATTPRVALNVLESPEHIKVYTLRRLGISTGEVFFNLTTNPEMGERVTGAIEPYEAFPIEGAEGFEALEYYLPFDALYGTEKRAEYDEARILKSLTTPKTSSRTLSSDPKTRPFSDIQLARLGAGGFMGIIRSAYRSEGNVYAERIINFSINFPVTGGGIFRVADAAYDIINSTFNPRAPIPRKKAPNRDLLLAFNRTHRPISSSAADLKRRRIQEAEASMKEHDRQLPPSRVPLLPTSAPKDPDLLVTDMDEPYDSD